MQVWIFFYFIEIPCYHYSFIGKDEFNFRFFNIQILPMIGNAWKQAPSLYHHFFSYYYDYHAYYEVIVFICCILSLLSVIYLILAYLYVAIIAQLHIYVAKKMTKFQTFRATCDWGIGKMLQFCTRKGRLDVIHTN